MAFLRSSALTDGRNPGSFHLVTLHISKISGLQGLRGRERESTKDYAGSFKLYSISGHTHWPEPNHMAPTQLLRICRFHMGRGKENRTNEHLASLCHSLPQWSPKFHFILLPKWVCLSTCLLCYTSSLFPSPFSQLAFSYFTKEKYNCHLSSVLVLIIVQGHKDFPGPK